MEDIVSETIYSAYKIEEMDKEFMADIMDDIKSHNEDSEVKLTLSMRNLIDSDEMVYVIVTKN